MKMKLKNYNKPTPRKLKRLGDSLLAVSVMTIPVGLSGHEWVTISIFAIAVVGKFLTNFFAEDESAN